MNRLNRSFKWLIFGKGTVVANLITAVLLALLPESCFCGLRLFKSLSDQWTIVVNRLILLLIVFVMSNAVYRTHRNKRKKASVGGDCRIQVEEGNLFDVSKGKVLVSFDECYTTAIGDAPAEIKPGSVCGQYLLTHPIDDMQKLISAAGVKPAEGKSRYKGRTCYEPGTIVPNGRYLLMAFAKLDSYGVGRLSYDEYISCLNLLWKQIDVYCGMEDVYLPVLGSGIVRFDYELTQQQLLDIMVGSYRLSSHKLKEQHTLHIVYKSRDGFSINRVFGIE